METLPTEVALKGFLLDLNQKKLNQVVLEGLKMFSHS